MWFPPNLRATARADILRTMKVVLAIDPGLDGAIARVERPTLDAPLIVTACEDLPTWSEKLTNGKTRRYIDPVKLAAIIEGMGDGADMVICERLIAPPGIAGGTALSMGATEGTIAAVLRIAGLRHKLVSSGSWKRALECPADKEAARQFAKRLFKSEEHWKLKKHHNRAEAALIGAWGLLTH